MFCEKEIDAKQFEGDKVIFGHKCKIYAQNNWHEAKTDEIELLVF